MTTPRFIVKCAMIKRILFRKNNLLYSLNSKTNEIQVLFTGKDACMNAMQVRLDSFLKHWIAQYNGKQERKENIEKTKLK